VGKIFGRKKIASVSKAWELAAKDPDDTEPVFRKKNLGKNDVIKLNGNSITVVQFQVK